MWVEMDSQWAKERRKEGGQEENLFAFMAAD